MSKPKSSFVYFIANSQGHVKIGKSEDPARRLKGLQTGGGTDLVLLGAIPGGLAEERSWHQRFESKRVGLEWFACDEELAAAIDAACKNLPPLFAYRAPGTAVRKRVARKSGAVEAGVSRRINAFFRKRHPEKTAQHVSDATGIKQATIKALFDRGTCPSFDSFLAMLGAYGVEFLRAVCSEDCEIPWVSRAYDDRLNSDEFKRERDLKQFRDLLVRSSAIATEIEAQIEALA